MNKELERIVKEEAAYRYPLEPDMDESAQAITKLQRIAFIGGIEYLSAQKPEFIKVYLPTVYY